MANTFKLTAGKDLQYIGTEVSQYLQLTEKMEVQVLHLSNGAMLIQARSRGGKVKQFVGMDKVISVQLNPIGSDYLSVEVGKGKWCDKGIVMAVSMFVLWPLAVTSGVGMAKQAALPSKINHIIAMALCS